MPLTPIGDIGTATLSENTSTQPIAWATAGDWDAQKSASGIVHEDRLDMPGADVLKMGVPSDLSGLFTLHVFEDTDGPPSADVIGGNQIDNQSGLTFGQTGRANSNTWSGDGDDVMGAEVNNSSNDFDNPGGDGQMAVAFWMKQDGSSQGSNPRSIGTSDNGYRQYIDGGGGGNFHWQVDGSNDFQYAANWATDGSEPWHLVLLGCDGTTQYIYVDNAQKATNGSKSTPSTNGGQLTYFNKEIASGTDDGFNGRLDDIAWLDTWPSSSVRQALYDAGTTATLTTATKSFSTPSTPDLQNLIYSLNGESITLDITGSPAGTSETVTQTLDGSSSYNLSWSNSHTDFEVTITMSVSTPINSPTLSQVELAP